MQSEPVIVAAQAELDQRWESAVAFLAEMLEDDREDEMAEAWALLMDRELDQALKLLPPEVVCRFAALAMDEAIFRLTRRIEEGDVDG